MFIFEIEKGFLNKKKMVSLQQKRMYVCLEILSSKTEFTIQQNPWLY